MDKIAGPGSIFTFNNQHYIFLAYNPQTERIYAARIHDQDTTTMLLDYRRRAEKDTKYDLSKEARLNFVILTTDDFEGQAAFFGRMDHQNPEIETIYGQLNDKDLTELKAEIKASGVSPEIKNRIQEM